MQPGRREEKEKRGRREVGGKGGVVRVGGRLKGREREVEKGEGEGLSINEGHTVVALASMLPQRISPSAVPPYPK